MPASTRPPSAPTAAASVGVASPKTMEPSTAMISTASGKNDASSILKISSRCQFISQLTSNSKATPMAAVIQNQVGAGTRSADAASGALAGDAVATVAGLVG